MNIESITSAKSILIHIKSHPNYPIHETKTLMNHIKTHADLGAKCIVGTVWDDTMKEDEVKITLIATGFDIKSENNHDYNLNIENEDHNQNISLSKKLTNWLAKYI